MDEGGSPDPLGSWVLHLAEDRVKALANSDDEMELFRAKISLEILIEIDAETI